MKSIEIIEIHRISNEFHEIYEIFNKTHRRTNGAGFGVISIYMLRMIVGCVAASYVRCGRSSLTSPLLGLLFETLGVLIVFLAKMFRVAQLNLRGVVALRDLTPFRLL